MSSRGQSTGDTVKRRSGWLIPLAVFAITALLSLMFLLLYLVPTPTSFFREHQTPTSRTDVVRLSVGGLPLNIPANYLLYASARQGGEQPHVDLFARFPDFRGYSDWYSQIFNSNNIDSPVIYMLIHVEPYNLSDDEQLKRIYLNYVADPKGKTGPFGLYRYVFREDSGYRHEDLFVGRTKQGAVVMNCARLSADDASPSCLRDVRLSNSVVLSYRFKRAHLGDWREIAQGVDILVRSFLSRTG